MSALIDPDVLAIEEAALAAWPAAEVQALGPWRLRNMAGVTNRANSVWAGPGTPDAGLEAGIDEVERFYAARSLAPMFQVMPLSDLRLDPLLAARGYAIFDPVSVQVAQAARVAQLPRRAGAGCESAMSEAWFEISGRRGRFAGEATDVYRGLLERLAGRAGFASACDPSGRIVAVGLTVLAPPLAGVFSMLTLPDQRGRGLGKLVLGAIARFATGHGVQHLYLQVDVENAPARALYTRSGFRESHRTHYRRRS